MLVRERSWQNYWQRRLISVLYYQGIRPVWREWSKYLQREQDDYVRLLYSRKLRATRRWEQRVLTPRSRWTTLILFLPACFIWGTGTSDEWQFRQRFNLARNGHLAKLWREDFKDDDFVTQPHVIVRALNWTNRWKSPRYVWAMSMSVEIKWSLESL